MLCRDDIFEELLDGPLLAFYLLRNVGKSMSSLGLFGPHRLLRKEAGHFIPGLRFLEFSSSKHCLKYSFVLQLIEQ